MSWLRLWFGFDAKVRQKEYLLSGLALMPVKFAGDMALFKTFAGVWLTPLDYLTPIAGDLPGKWLQMADLGRWLTVLWLLPFLWIGVSMTVRRVADAEVWPGLVLLFFVPIFNYAVMLYLVTARRGPSRARSRAPAVPPSRAASFAGLVLAVAFPVAMVALAANGSQRYGGGIFVGTPFAIGVIAGYAMNLTRLRTLGETAWGCGYLLLAAGAACLLLAFEGLLCIFMAAPILIPLVWLGMLLGRSLARIGAGTSAAGVFLILPGGMLAFDQRPNATPEREIVSSVEVAAPPEVVWRHVVAFSDLPPPRHWMFALGIAHPVRARIEGSGVGAVRRCEFSTGPFVEPITHWEEPRRLAFRVTEHPLPMKELSPWGDIHPPHLDGWFRATRGEFRLVPLPGGRTRLEGSTWYALDLAPETYWRLWAETLVHAIHDEVLEHVKSLAEQR